jgi:hypothetical protein
MIAIPSPIIPREAAARVNVAVNNSGGAYPSIAASYSAPSSPAVNLNDGNYRYPITPPNRWTDSGDVQRHVQLVLDFGTPRSIDELTLYFLDDGPQSLVRAPERVGIESWDGQRWAPAPAAMRDPVIPEGHRANHLRFTRPLRTSRVRLTLDHRPARFTGLTEIEAWSATSPSPTERIAPPLDLAYNATGAGFPKMSASFTSQYDKVEEAADGRVAFSRYSRNRWTAFGSPNASDWLQVDFGAPQLVETVDLYLWGDDRGVKAPRSYAVQYWNGTRWQDASVVSRLPERPATWAVNTVRLRPVRTSKVRVRFEHDGAARTGVTEMTVWGPDPFSIER